MPELATALTQSLAAGLMLFAAGLFTSAVLHKIRTFAEFTGFVGGYRLVPDSLIAPASGIVVIAEIAAIPAALGLIPGFAYLPVLLLLAYAAAMGVNLFRGRRDIDCGCGGTPMPISNASVARNLVLATAFGWAAFRAVDLVAIVQGAPTLIPAILGFALCLGLVYAVSNQLEANRAIRRRGWERAA